MQPLRSSSPAPRRGGRRVRRLALATACVAGAALGAAPVAGAAQSQQVAWGAGATGTRHGGSVTAPTTVTGAAGATAASVGAFRTLVVSPSGVLVTGTGEANGSLGLGAGVAAPTLTPIPGTAGTVAVAAGDDASLLLRGDGTVWGFGPNQDGAAGGTVGEIRRVPARVAGVDGVTAIAAGAGASLALTATGEVWAWGRAETLGSAAGAPTATPVRVPLPGGRAAREIAAGGDHALALLDDGSIAAWGVNGAGQLGDGTTAPAVAPRLVHGFPIPGGDPQRAVRSISAGSGTSYALLADGSHRAWGSNAVGQLGLGTGSDADVTEPAAPNPNGLTPFPPRPAFTQLSAGLLGAYGLTAAGQVYAWGYAGDGQLGSDALGWGFPYSGAGGTAGQVGTEIPQRVGTLRNVPWLATGGVGQQQLVRADLNLQRPATSGDSFFEVGVGTISRPQDVVVQAIDSDATIRRVSITGPDARDFLIVHSDAENNPPYGFPVTVPRLDQFGVTLRFAPSAPGERHATLNVHADGETAAIALSGVGVPAQGGVPGPPGPPGALGAAGPAGAGGPPGLTPPRSRSTAAITLTAAAGTVRARRGRTAALRFTLRNATDRALAKATASFSAPKALRAARSRGVTVKALAVGKRVTVTVPLKVGAAARLGTHRVTVRLRIGSTTIARTVHVRVVR